LSFPRFSNSQGHLRSKKEGEGRRMKEMELPLLGWDIRKAFHLLEAFQRKERPQ
jgi:hypothetical protein